MPKTTTRRVIRYFREPDPVFVSLVKNPATGAKFEVVRMVTADELAAAQMGGPMPAKPAAPATPEAVSVLRSALAAIQKALGLDAGPETVRREVPRDDFKTQWDAGKAQSDIARASYLLSDVLWWVQMGAQGSGGLTAAELAAADTALRQYADVVMGALRTVKRSEGDAPILGPAVGSLPALVAYLESAEVVDRAGKKIAGGRQKKLSAALAKVAEGAALLDEVLKADGDPEVEVDADGEPVDRSVEEDEMTPELKAALDTLNGSVTALAGKIEAVERAQAAAATPPAAAPDAQKEVLDAIEGVKRSVEGLAGRVAAVEAKSVQSRSATDDPPPAAEGDKCQGFFRAVENG